MYSLVWKCYGSTNMHLLSNMWIPLLLFSLQKLR